MGCRALRPGRRSHALLARRSGRGEDRAIAEIVILRCNVDYSGTGNTWACHSSYLHSCDPQILPQQMLPFLASRPVLCGAGGFNSLPRYELQFTLSPRVWHLVSPVSPSSTHSRGIFHTKDEPLSAAGYHRLHILCGDSACSEIAMWLKVATTALVVALIDGGVHPGDDVQLRAPVAAMQRFASDPTCKAWAVGADNKRWTATAIQRHYLAFAEEHANAPFMPPWADEACRRWREMLDRLDDGAPDSVSTLLDWAIKLVLFRDRARRRGFAWESLHDLERRRHQARQGAGARVGRAADGGRDQRQAAAPWRKRSPA